MTGEASAKSVALHGKATISFASADTRQVYAKLFLQEQAISLVFGQSHDLRDTLRINNNCAIHSASFESPAGFLKLQNPIECIVRSWSDGGWSVQSSQLSRFYDDHLPPARISVMLPPTTSFSSAVEGDEVLFAGPVPNIPELIDLGGGQSVISRRRSLSLFGLAGGNLRLAQGALSVASGASLRRCARHFGKEITTYGNKFSTEDSQGRQMYFAGYPHANLDMIRDRFVEVYNCAASKLSQGISGLDAIGAVSLYLDGRSAAGYMEFKTFAAFHLWEFLDGSRTINKQTLAPLLSVGLDEAEAIVEYRNTLLHNRASGEMAAGVLAGKLAKLPSAFYLSLRPDTLSSKSVAAMNYVFSLTDRALLRWIGFSGKVQQYIPNYEAKLL